MLKVSILLFISFFTVNQALAFEMDCRDLLNLELSSISLNTDKESKETLKSIFNQEVQLKEQKLSRTLLGKNETCTYASADKVLQLVIKRSIKPYAKATVNLTARPNQRSKYGSDYVASKYSLKISHVAKSLELERDVTVTRKIQLLDDGCGFTECQGIGPYKYGPTEVADMQLTIN